MSRLALREFHGFEAAGQRFLYLVPSAGVVRLDETSAAVLDSLSSGPRRRDEVLASLHGTFEAAPLDAAITELLQIRAIGPAAAPPEKTLKVLPSKQFPLTTMVLNVTSKCNLACTYCYEYGEDRVVEPTKPMPRFMDDATARQSVDFLFQQSGENRVIYLNFFGGETLLNFPVLQRTLAYARERGAETGKRVESSITTNGTLLKPEIIEWLAENDVTVTISIDGPKEVQDQFRVFHSGKGSYDVMLPKVKELLQRHTSRPIGARVTLTRDNLDVEGIFRHLTEEVGFKEGGLAPRLRTRRGGDRTTPSGGAIGTGSGMLGQCFQKAGAGTLAWRAAVRRGANRRRFSTNQGDLEGDPQGGEQGVSLRRGALGLMGVANRWDVGRL